MSDYNALTTRLSLTGGLLLDQTTNDDLTHGAPSTIVPYIDQRGHINTFIESTWCRLRWDKLYKFQSCLPRWPGSGHNVPKQDVVLARIRPGHAYHPCNHSRQSVESNVGHWKFRLEIGRVRNI